MRRPNMADEWSMVIMNAIRIITAMHSIHPLALGVQCCLCAINLWKQRHSSEKKNKERRMRCIYNLI